MDEKPPLSDGAEKELAMKFDLIKGTLVITVGRGERFSFASKIRTNGVLDDLTGKTFVGKVKTVADVEVATLTVTVNGLGTIAVDGGDTSAWPLEDLKFDLLMNPDQRWIYSPGSMIRMNYSATVGL